ncbi:cytochrome P450 [Aspergillus vadensis CBS 113365]|uniref:Cytochrome P450 monooxygenase n=1 Tax=Aspergillus vadensis (strain CBS 113365 / IMI 142717 / IBT 24658) TaxID=1448311 RepID=A0A319AV09_ASPVC|nr:cytochrome P450 monooxygenase [Aspergillus vadensis CBS 113365]PYH64197.1 cytochrome P450 monooxygenase [Aspergillus vadensis CBS 113365]
METTANQTTTRPSTQATVWAGWDQMLGVVEYSDRFQEIRRALHQGIGSAKCVSQYNSVQEVEVRRFLLRLLDDPHSLNNQLRKMTGAVALQIAYGYTVEPHDNDPLVDLAERAVHDLGLVLTPGNWIVDVFPLLRYLPAWLPGAKFVRMADSFRKTATAFCDVPCTFVKRRLAQSDFRSSFLSNSLRNQEGLSETDESVLKWSAAAIYAGGADTTVSTLATFFLAMTLYPEVQAKARAEIQSVLGPDRLPGFEDRDNLPYINAIVKETLRWHATVPIITHKSIAPDVCDGYDIPQGSWVMANVWAMNHDPNTYVDPFSFKPERFLGSEGRSPEPDPHTFGFGRRICPGRNLARANIYLTVAQSLAAFQISKPRKNSTDSDFRPEFQAGFVSSPVPYEIDIRVRSPAYENLIRTVETEYPWEQSHSKEITSLAS